MFTRLRSFYYYIFQQQNLPTWIVYLNYASLIGIFAWPIVTFMSIFLSDSPSSNFTGFDYLLIVSYPIGLILVTFVSFKIFKLNKAISASLPIVVVIFYLFLIIKFLNSIYT